MKKITILLSAFALFVSFVGCSNSGKTDKRITEPASISQSVTLSAANQKKTTQQSKNTMHIDKKLEFKKISQDSEQKSLSCFLLRICRFC